MTSKRLFYILIAAVVILMGAGGAIIYFGNSYLQKRSNQLLSLKAESVALQQQQESLNQAKKDVAKYAELEKIAKTIVPQEKDQAKTVREIIQLADESGIPIATISFPTSSLGGTAAKTTTPATGTTPAATNKTAISQLTPVAGIAGLYEMEITVQSNTSNAIPYARLLTFLSKLEQSRRTAQVKTITIQPSPQDRSKLTFSVVLNVYIKP